MATSAFPEANRYLNHSVSDLLSLKGRTIVITGGARGLGLAFTLACAEQSGNVAVLDAADAPHEHFYDIQKKFDVKLEYYKSVISDKFLIYLDDMLTPNTLGRMLLNMMS